MVQEQHLSANAAGTCNVHPKTQSA